MYMFVPAARDAQQQLRDVSLKLLNIIAEMQSVHFRYLWSHFNISFNMSSLETPEYRLTKRKRVMPLILLQKNMVVVYMVLMKAVLKFRASSLYDTFHCFHTHFDKNLVTQWQIGESIAGLMTQAWNLVCR